MLRIIRHRCIQVGESEYVSRYSTHDIELAEEIETLFSDTDGNFIGVEVIKHEEAITAWNKRAGKEEGE